MSRNIASIVEGHADVPAVRELLRRLLAATGDFETRVLPPHRVPRNDLVRPGVAPGKDLDRVLALQSGRAGTNGLVVVVLDADDDDPYAVAELIYDVGSQYPCWLLPVVATREYEAWFLAAIHSLRNHPAVRDDAHFEGDPEQPRDAKGKLEESMTTAYKEVRHQPAFTSTMDLTQAGTASHFAEFRAALGAWSTGCSHPLLRRPSPQ